MKILVTGANGMHGWGWRKALQGHEVIYTGREQLDITDHDSVLSFKSVKPGLIVHLAAETDHHQAERNPEQTYMVNTIGTANIVDLAMKLKVPVCYIGTCGMFDGKKDYYVFGDEPTPLNIYGRSKWYGEMLVKNYKRHFIFRCGWAMGGGENIDIKFVGQIWRQIKAGKSRIFAIKDVYGSPTYTPQFAKVAMDVITSGMYIGCGVAIAGEKATRYDVANEFVKLLGLPVEVVPVTYDEYHAMYPCQTPYTKCEVLSVPNDIVPRMNWKQGLAEYVKECYAPIILSQ